MDKKSVIEKHILQRIYINRMSLPDAYIKELYNHLREKIESELESKELLFEDFNNVFEDLEERGFIIVDHMPMNETQIGNFDELNYIVRVNDNFNEDYITVDYMEEMGFLNPAVLAKSSYSQNLSNFCISDNQKNNLEKFIANCNTITSTNILEVKTLLSSTSKDLDEKINEHEDQIKSFYGNILTILSILIAAFSIIGFNIGGVKDILSSQEILSSNELVGSIVVINISTVFSLYFLLYLIDKIVNGRKGEKHTSRIFSNLTAIIVLVLFIAILIYNFFISEIVSINIFL